MGEHRLPSEKIGEPFEGWRRLLAKGVEAGQVVARRQVLSVIEQARHLAGDESMVVGLVADAEKRGFADERLRQAAETARRQAAELADWLEKEYLPHADPEDGVGEERYLRSAEEFLGMTIDPAEVYEWGGRRSPASVRR